MKIKQLLLGIALLALTTACAEKLEVNPNYNPDTRQVVTNLAFNISLGESPATKQHASAVQIDGKKTSFLGIQDAVLMSYVLPDDGKILAADADAYKVDTLGKILEAEAIGEDTNGEKDSRRVIEMTLPLGTNTLLFYGRSIPKSANVDGFSPYDYYGHLEKYNISKEEGSAIFQLGKRLKDEEEALLTTTELLLSGILSIIMNTNLAGENHVAISASAAPSGEGMKPYGYDVPADKYPQLYWAQYATSNMSPVSVTCGGSSHTQYPLEVKLATSYKQMTSINSAKGELRAASGEALLRTVKDLFTVINEVRCAEPMNAEEAVAKYMANRIIITMQHYFSPTNMNTSGAPITGADFLDILGEGGIRAFFLADSKPNVTGQDYTGVWPSSDELQTLGNSGKSLKNFPFDYNLPRGATHMAFDETRQIFYYPTAFNTSGMGGATGADGGSYNANSYYYPAELTYFGNSSIRTSTAEHIKNDYPNGSDNWRNDASWSSDWSGKSVTSSTRSVAMKYDIRYGTALLKTMVRYKSNILEDNNHNVQAELQGKDSLALSGEPNNEIDVSQNSPFQLTGIIIGGQYQNVGWDYLPTLSGTTFKTGFIYDKAIASKTIPTYDSDPSVTSHPNYTLVFDNFISDGIAVTAANHDALQAKQEKVYIALEFLNNGNDFYGNHNLVRSGGYFYLIAELDPAKSSTVTWPENYVIPPYNPDGTSNHITRVFMQACMTTAIFSFDKNSLKKAYLTVPDLRAGSMHLGMSVNLEWHPGANFEDSVLGGE